VEGPRSFRSNSMNPLQTLPAVEIAIKAEYQSNAVPLHDRNVNSVARRHRHRILDYLRRAQDVGFLDGDHFVDHFQRHLKRWPDGFALINRRITVENLLQDFSVSDETLPRRNEALQDNLYFGLVGMRGADQVHRNIGIYEDQPS